jgi:hypothetical protein
MGRLRLPGQAPCFKLRFNIRLLGTAEADRPVLFSELNPITPGGDMAARRKSTKTTAAKSVTKKVKGKTKMPIKKKSTT